jgi:hypothetical protein
MERMSQEMALDIAEQAEVALVGRIRLGKTGPHQVESTISDPEVPALFEEARQKLVPVERDKSACCIDGRCAACTAAQVANLQNTDQPLENSIVHERVPVRAHVAGGTFHFATLMALAANIPLVQGAKTFAEAKTKVASFLSASGFEDAAHSTLSKVWDKNATGCGAMDALVPGVEDANAESDEFEHTGQTGVIAEAMAPLYGYENADSFMKDDMYAEVRHNLVQGLGAGIFEGYVSADYRDAMRNNTPESLELLAGDHVEQGIAINEVEGYTVDRDAIDGKLFIYDRWFANKLAWALAGSEYGQRRLLMAGDYVTMLITNQLVAPGQPVGVIRTAA